MQHLLNVTGCSASISIICLWIVSLLVSSSSLVSLLSISGSPNEGSSMKTSLRTTVGCKPEYVDVVGQMFLDAGDLLTSIYLDTVNNEVLDNKHLELFKRNEE